MPRNYPRDDGRQPARASRRDLHPRGHQGQGHGQSGGAATLRASRIRVIGNVQAEGAASVYVVSSRIGGSVQVVQGRSSRLARNRVKGDVQYFENSGTIRITKNHVDGNLQCKENRARPRGGGNVVQGNKEDQCARLQSSAIGSLVRTGRAPGAHRAPFPATSSPPAPTGARSYSTGAGCVRQAREVLTPWMQARGRPGRYGWQPPFPCTFVRPAASQSRRALPDETGAAASVSRGTCR
jgi:hypothetical protein